MHHIKYMHDFFVLLVYDTIIGTFIKLLPVTRIMHLPIYLVDRYKEFMTKFDISYSKISPKRSLW